jgi:hypothetical protein
MTAPKATSLKSLPTKIKILLLLNLPDPASLRAFVRASALYHGLYRCQRRLFLSTALFNCLSYNGLHIALTVLEASIILQEVDNQDGDDEEDLISENKDSDIVFSSSLPRYICPDTGLTT